MVVGQFFKLLFFQPPSLSIYGHYCDREKYIPLLAKKIDLLLDHEKPIYRLQRHKIERVFSSSQHDYKKKRYSD